MTLKNFRGSVFPAMPLPLHGVGQNKPVQQVSQAGYLAAWEHPSSSQLEIYTGVPVAARPIVLKWVRGIT